MYRWLCYFFFKDVVYYVLCILFGLKNLKEKLFLIELSGDWKNFSFLIVRYLKDDFLYYDNIKVVRRFMVGFFVLSKEKKYLLISYLGLL